MIKLVGNVIYAGVVAGMAGVAIHAIKDTYIENQESIKQGKLAKNKERLAKHDKQIRMAQKQAQFDNMWNDYFNGETGKIS